MTRSILLMGVATLALAAPAEAGGGANRSSSAAGVSRSASDAGNCLCSTVNSLAGKATRALRGATSESRLGARAGARANAALGIRSGRHGPHSVSAVRGSGRIGLAGSVSGFGRGVDAKAGAKVGLAGRVSSDGIHDRLAAAAAKLAVAGKSSAGARAALAGKAAAGAKLGTAAVKAGAGAKAEFAPRVGSGGDTHGKSASVKAGLGASIHAGLMSNKSASPAQGMQSDSSGTRQGRTARPASDGTAQRRQGGTTRQGHSGKLVAQAPAVQSADGGSAVRKRRDVANHETAAVPDKPLPH